jgi:hypothetical protein
LGYKSFDIEISSLNSSVLLRTINILAWELLKYLIGSTTKLYDLPPPALPPYNTSCSVAERKEVCGPGLG